MKALNLHPLLLALIDVVVPKHASLAKLNEGRDLRGLAARESVARQIPIYTLSTARSLWGVLRS
jgi:hypothetical protein